MFLKTDKKHNTDIRKTQTPNTDEEEYTMRFNDVQDTRKAEVRKEQRDAAVQKIYSQLLERLSCVNMCNRKAVMAFGATFTI